jgi:hypothetical protein
MEKGFIQLIIIILLVVIVLSLLGVSFLDVSKNKTLKENFSYIFSGLKSVWDNYLRGPVVTVWEIFWNTILRPLKNIGNNFLENLRGAKIPN